MPATALRHPETAEELDVPAVSSRPLPLSSSAPHLEWRTVAPYVDRFTGAAPAIERVSPRKKRARHKPFVLTGPFLAGTLVFLQLMGLVWVYALDLKTWRQNEQLDRQIQEISLQKALTLNKLASYKSAPLLAQWASELGYRPIEPTDFDDVTSNAPLPAPAKEDKEEKKD